MIGYGKVKNYPYCAKISNYNHAIAHGAAFFVLLILSLGFSIIFLIDPKFIAISLNSLCWFTLIIFILAFCFNSFFMKLHILSLPQIFVIVTFSFTSGLLMLHAFGLAVISESIRWYNEVYASIAAEMVILSVLCLEFGICIGYFKKSFISNTEKSTINNDYAQSLFKLGLVTFFIAIFILMLLTALGGGFAPMFESGYRKFVLARKQSDVRLFLTSLNWLLPTSSLILAAGWRNVKQSRIANISAFFTVLAFLLGGDRGCAIGFLLGFALTMRLVGKKYSFKKIIFAGLIVLLIIPIIHTMRQVPISEAISPNLYYGYEKSLAVSAFSEMGTSFQTLMGSLMIVPEREDFRYGSTYLYGFLKIFPNLGGWHRSGDLSGVYPDRSLTTWITYHMRPQAVASGHGGLGFLQIAEFYIQFGIFGIFFGYILLGFLLMKWQIKCENGINDRRWIAINGCLIYALTIWVRNDILVFVRPITWSIIFILVGVFFAGGRGDAVIMEQKFILKEIK